MMLSSSLLLAVSLRDRLPRRTQEQQHDPQHDKHAQRRILPIPRRRLPHDKPFPTHSEKREQPLQHAEHQAIDRQTFGALKHFRFTLERMTQMVNAKPTEPCAGRFPRNQSAVKKMMKNRI